MKTILLWDARFPGRRPALLTLDDALASACVRAGVAAAANPADQAALAAGGALDPGGPIEVVLEVAPIKRLVRAVLPASVAAIGASLGLCASVSGAPIGGGSGPSPTTIVIAGTLPAGKLGQPYSGALSVSVAGAKTRIAAGSPTSAAALAALGLSYDGTTHTVQGNPA